MQKPVIEGRRAPFSEFTKGKWADRDLLNGYIKHLNVRFAPRSVKRKLAGIPYVVKILAILIRFLYFGAYPS